MSLSMSTKADKSVQRLAAEERNCSHCQCLVLNSEGVTACSLGVWELKNPTSQADDQWWYDAVVGWQETLSSSTTGKAKTKPPFSFYAADCMYFKPRTERYFSKQADGSVLFRWYHRCVKCQSLFRRLASCYLCGDLLCTNDRKKFNKRGIIGYICLSYCGGTN